MKASLLIYMLSFALLSVLAGCNKATLPAAKIKHEKGEYFEAAAIYRKVYSKTPSKEKKKRAEISSLMGDCYKRLNMHARAASAFQIAIRNNPSDSVALLHLATMVHAQGRYPQAAKLYDQYLEKSPTSLLGLNGRKGVELALKWKSNPSRYIVRRETVFNSRRADFSPMLAGDKYDQLYLSSSNDKFTKTITRSAITGMKDNDIFFSKKNEKGAWEVPVPIEGELNTEMDEGTPSISFDGLKMYITRCNKSDNTETTAEIAESARSGGKWNKANTLPLWKDDSTRMAAHPAISPQGDYLYFVSDQGGYGGKDIFRAEITAVGVGSVENLGSRINTAGDETFPYVRSNGELYFASNGHPGMGGLDLFRARMKDDGTWQVENMQAPVNSSSDDFGITFAGEDEEGFFSSNRNDGRGWDHIYSFRLPSVSVFLEGFVVDKEDEIIPNATIRVIGNDGTILRTQSKVDGTYRIKLDYGRDYVMQAVARNFLNAKEQVVTFDKEKDTVYVQDFVLLPIAKPMTVENILYAFDKADILPESAQELDVIVSLMNEHPNITVQMSAHTDRKGPDKYNEGLSQRRAESAVNYLIEKGISPDRLDAKGYGETVPKKITKKLTALHPEFLKEGDVLNEPFVDALTPEQQEVADQFNRRTEFTIISTNYKLN